MSLQDALGLMLALAFLSWAFPSNTLRILVAGDIFIFAVITLGRAKRNETMSSAAWSSERDGKILGRLFRPLIDGLFYPVQQDHCFKSWQAENGDTAT